MAKNPSQGRALGDRGHKAPSKHTSKSAAAKANAKASKGASKRSGSTRSATKSVGGASHERGVLDGYTPVAKVYDEVFRPSGKAHHGVERVAKLLGAVSRREFRQRQNLADAAFMRSGVTFSVYADQRGSEKIFPFDLIPRIVAAEHWQTIEDGLRQRVRALNLFLADLYSDQKILRDRAVPEELLLSSTCYLPAVRGIKPSGGVFVHIAGIDLIRRPNGEFVVLEDNARTPSGVSYVLENRAMMKRIFPTLLAEAEVRSVDLYPLRLREALLELSPVAREESRLVILTPGPFNSAYFEHTFLARRMGVPLVLGADLFVDNQEVYLKTTRGPERVHVIYRRVDDEFLDPKVFREDSLLGVPGLLEAYAAGNVTLANAVGNGVVDDKCAYAVLPDAIRYYLSEEPILKQVPTYLCLKDDDRRYVLDHLDEMVVKQVDASGGYGMLMGPSASKKELAEFRQRIEAKPRSYIAQPRIELSTCPSWTADGAAPRRVDLRPYVITGKETWVLPGGLTRVALKKGSYVVNSSQGGGSKDTWVLADPEHAPDDDDVSLVPDSGPESGPGSGTGSGRRRPPGAKAARAPGVATR